MRITRTLALAGLALCLSVGCASKQQTDDTLVFEDELRPISMTELQEAEPARSRQGMLSRSQLKHTVEQGFGRFLNDQQIDMEAETRDGRFLGWRLVRWNNPWVDLVPGDVVLSVNGAAIETGAQVQRLWLTLPASEEIVVAAQRQGQNFELRFQVQ